LPLRYRSPQFITLKAIYQKVLGSYIGKPFFASQSEENRLIKAKAVAAHYGDAAEPITILTLSEVKLADAKATIRKL